MKKSSIYIALSAILLTFSTPSTANEYAAKAKTLIETKISTWLKNEKITKALKAQNTSHAGMTKEKIDSLDQQWRKNEGTLVADTLGNDLSSYLKTIKEESGGLYTEIFVMDEHGLNVGQSDKTSDYYQGDEAKYKETYLKGPGSVHLSDVEEDESSQTFQMQISIPITEGDAASGKNIGAVTIGVNAEML